MSHTKRRARALLGLALAAGLATGCLSSNGPRLERGKTVEPTTEWTVRQPTTTTLLGAPVPAG